jgi:hypothetical protein
MTEKNILPVDTIVRSDHPVWGLTHGAPFGVVKEMRPQIRTGKGWGRIEYRVERKQHGMTGAWIDENFVEVASLNDVLAYYDERERGLRDRIKKLRDMVGTKVPKYNPEKVLGSDAEGWLSDAYRHEDGSITYVFGEKNPEAESPRTYGGNVATLINTNSRTIDVDEDDADLAEAVERWVWPGHPDPNGNLVRYLKMFRPDILHFDPHWSAGDSYGWGYVTRKKWEAAMGADYDGDLTPEQAFDQEVKVYGQWANNEIYGSAHVAKRGEEPDFVYGHLGYDDHRDIAAYHTDSPVLEILH